MFFSQITKLLPMLGLERHKLKAAEICAQLLKELPPEFVVSQAKLLSVNRVTRTIENLAQRVSLYAKDANLGFLGRPLFLNALKWKLKELGYPDDFSSVVMEAAVMASMKKN